MPADQVQYSEKYYAGSYEYRLVSSEPLKYLIALKIVRHKSFFESFVLTIRRFVFFTRHVIVSPELARKVPKSHLMSETEWRNLGVQQSPGWVHYMVHNPGKLETLVDYFVVIVLGYVYI